MVGPPAGLFIPNNHGKDLQPPSRRFLFTLFSPEQVPRVHQYSIQDNHNAQLAYLWEYLPESQIHPQPANFPG